MVPVLPGLAHHYLGGEERHRQRVTLSQKELAQILLYYPGTGDLTFCGGRVLQENEYGLWRKKNQVEISFLVLAIWTWESCLTSQSVKQNNNTSVIGLLWGLNEITSAHYLHLNNFWFFSPLCPCIPKSCIYTWYPSLSDTIFLCLQPLHMFPNASRVQALDPGVLVFVSPTK